MTTQLGKYTLRKTIGEGSFSKVKLAVDKKTGDYFAIKVHYPGSKHFETHTLNTIANEIVTLEALKNHPNIIKLVDW